MNPPVNKNELAVNDSYRYQKIKQYKCEFKPTNLEFRCKTITRFFKTCKNTGKSIEYLERFNPDEEIVVSKL
jgi:hypothetical protein